MPLPSMPPAQPEPPAPFPVPPMPVATPAPVTPLGAPPQFFGQAYPTGGWAPMPPYFQAPVQPYLIGYPPTCWPQYLPYYAAPQGGFDKDSETSKPNKVTGWDPSKLRPFIFSCIMAFDSRSHKFVTD